MATRSRPGNIDVKGRIQVDDKVLWPECYFFVFAQVSRTLPSLTAARVLPQTPRQKTFIPALRVMYIPT